MIKEENGAQRSTFVNPKLSTELEEKVSIDNTFILKEMDNISVPSARGAIYTSAEASAKPVKVNYTSSLRDMIKRVKSEPRQTFIYSGIKENAVGFVFGPSKSGKTTYCENLAFTIASGKNEFLGLPVSIENKKVLIVSLEEFYQNRTERNIIQSQPLIEDLGEDWIDNIQVANDTVPQFIGGDEEWGLLENMVKEHQPGLVVFDSLSRIDEGKIEESENAKFIMAKMKKIAQECKTAIIIIHHTKKIGNEPLTMHSMAGSRVLSQEGDFFIGINVTDMGKRYIKEVAFRYKENDTENVTEFKIDENLWLKSIKKTTESKLLALSDGRTDRTNTNIILDFIKNSEKEEISSKELYDEFVPKKMSKPAIHDNLDKLIDDERIEKPSRGRYKLVG